MAIPSMLEFKLKGVSTLFDELDRYTRLDMPSHGHVQAPQLSMPPLASLSLWVYLPLWTET